MTEWRTVPNFERYEVSDDGRVRRRGGIELRADPVGGYQRYRLYNKGKSNTINVHRLMATVFLPNPDALPVVRHLERSLQ